MSNNIKSMITMVTDKVIDQIVSGDFSVPVVIKFLTKHINEKDAFVRAEVNRIIRSVKDAGYMVRNDAQRYYIYR